MGDRNEAIVRRFAISEENYVEVDNTFEISQWGSTKEQDYEFQIAFDLVAEGEKKINIRQVDDLFLAIGYTMQDSELENIFDKCLPEPDGKFTCDVLLEGKSEVPHKSEIANLFKSIKFVSVIHRQHFKLSSADSLAWHHH